MSEKYTVRYKVTRPSVMTSFWMMDKDDESSFREVVSVSESLGGTYDIDISLDGLVFNVDFTFDSDEKRKLFLSKVYEIDELYQKNYKQQYDERNEYHAKVGIVEETEFFEETS